MQPKYAQLRGDFAIRNITAGETSFTPLFNATSGELTPTITTEKVPSNGNKPGTIFTYETSRELTLTITTQSRHREALRAYLLAKSITVPASEDPISITIPAMKKGQLFELGHANVTKLTTTLEEGTDYELSAKSGVIEALQDIEEDDTATLEHGEYETFGIFSDDAQHYEILFFSEKTGQSYVFYDGLLVPSQAFSLVGESGIGSQGVTFELQQKEGAVTDPLLGKYGRMRDVSVS